MSHLTGLNESIKLAVETGVTQVQEVTEALGSKQAGLTGAILFSYSTLMHSK